MIGIDYRTLERNVKESANMFADIAKKNRIEESIINKVLNNQKST